MAKSGTECMKFIVPSIGSMMKRWSGSVPLTTPVSSVRKE